MAYTRCEANSLSSAVISMRRMCLKAALCAAVVGFAGFGSSMSAQVGTNAGFAGSGVDPMVQRNITDWAVRGKGVTDDWSDRHLVFPNPGAEQEAIKNGTYEQWLKIVNEPRFIKQQIKRAGGAKVLEGASITSFVSPTKNGTKKVALKKDWSMGLGAATGVLHPNTFPAKYNFSTTTESCSDYVVYPTGLAGTASQASIIAYNNIYLGASPGCTTNTGPPVYWAYNTGGTSSLSPVISDDGTQVAYIQTSASSVASLVLLKPGPNATGRTVTGTLSATSPNVTISVGSFSATDVGAQITGTGIPAGDTIASVLSATTATLAAAPTAHASETLTIVSETAAAPGVPIFQSNANYRSCVAPCYTTITLNGTTPNDTNSSPFYIYGGGLDTMYVGDNAGKVHQFTGVFYGAPAETTTSGWPVTTTASDVLTSPIYDSTSTLLFVGGSDGYLYSVSTGATPTVVKSALLSAGGSTGIVDAPLVDEMPASPKVYAFLGDPDSVVQFAYNFASNNAGISEALGSSAPGTKVYSGAFDNLHYDIAGGTGGDLWVCGYHNTGTTPRLYKVAMNATFTGAVTNTTTDPASSGTDTCSPVTEFLGAKANTTINVTGGITAASTSVTVASDTNIATGDYIQIDSEIILVSSVTGGTTVNFTPAATHRGQLGTTAAAHADGAAVQDIQDWLYLSVSAGGGATGCTGACLYNYSVTTTTTPGNATAGIAAAGGTSGVIIDNSLTGTGESQIYYSTLATSATACTGNGTTGAGTEVCAVQTSQSAP